MRLANQGQPLRLRVLRPYSPGLEVAMIRVVGLTNQNLPSVGSSLARTENGTPSSGIRSVDLVITAI